MLCCGGDVSNAWDGWFISLWRSGLGIGVQVPQRFCSDRIKGFMCINEEVTCCVVADGFIIEYRG